MLKKSLNVSLNNQIIYLLIPARGKEPMEFEVRCYRLLEQSTEYQVKVDTAENPDI